MKFILVFYAMFSIAASQYAQNGKISANITETVPADSIYVIPHTMPEFPGGQTAMFEYINNYLKHSDINWNDYERHWDAFITRFFVNKTGNIENIEIIRSTQIPKLDSIYCNLLRGMPPWKPGTINGENVNVYYVMPVRFRKLD